MSTASSHLTTDAAPAPQTTPQPITALQASLPEALLETMRRLSFTSVAQLDLSREVLQKRLSPSTPTDDGCSSTCGSTCGCSEND